MGIDAAEFLPRLHGDHDGTATTTECREGEEPANDADVRE
ncbi:hypothetical protein PLANPX_0739 [Lacipirellula parvula]|uniref:Uncharacterized protein n=1 Tax=Lacipirellula parvula TaxID=2650471 RepID=A0A5K7X5L7_9BACT|nr:hypothetical protein PLANPX_0739 [Lacipirellula parvula]